MPANGYLRFDSGLHICHAIPVEKKGGKAMRLRPPRQWKEVKGIFVGGCVKRGEGSSFRAKAHCHNCKAYPYFGWICVRSAKRIGSYHLFDERLADIGIVNYQEFEGAIDKPSQLLIHEYAHLLAPGQGHTPTFYRQLKDVGGHITADDRYRAPKAVKKALAKRR